MTRQLTKDAMVVVGITGFERELAGGASGSAGVQSVPSSKDAYTLLCPV